MNSSTEQASGFSVKTEKCEASGKVCRSFILTFKETDLIIGVGHLLSKFAERRLTCDTSVMDKALRVIGRLIAFD